MRTATVIRVLATAAVLSVAANMVLVSWGWALYRSIQSLRLNPSEVSDKPALSSPGPEETATAPVIALLGDSRVEHWSPLPQIENCTTISLGIAGQTTAQVLLRLPQTLMLRPAVLVVQVGINDLKSIGLFPHNQQQIEETCRRNLGAIIHDSRRQGTHVVVLTILPVGPIELLRRPIWSQATLEARDRINQFLRQQAGPGVTVVDCDAVLALRGRMRSEYAADALHMDQAGYEALNSLLRPILHHIAENRREADQSHAVQ